MMDAMDEKKNGHLGEWMLWKSGWSSSPNYLNHHPLKMDVLLKTFLQIIHAAKRLVRHSSTSSKQQRRPLPSLLSDFLLWFRCSGLYSTSEVERAKTVPRQVKGPGVPIRAVSSSVIMALVPAYTGHHVYTWLSRQLERIPTLCMYNVDKDLM